MKRHFQTLSNYFRKVSLYRRLVILLFMVLILISLVFMLTLRQSYRNYREAINYESSQLLSSYNYTITDTINTLDSVTKFQVIQNAHSKSVIYTQLLKGKGSWSNDFMANKEIKNEIKPLFDIGNNISTIAIVDKNANYIYCHQNAMVYQTFEGSPNASFLMKANDGQGAMIVINSDDVHESLLNLKENNIVGIRSIMSLSPRKSIGYAICSIDISSAISSFELSKSFSDERISYFDSDGQRLTGNVDNSIISQLDFTKSKYGRAYSQLVKANNQTLLCYFTRNKSGSMSIITLPYIDFLENVWGQNILIFAFLFFTIILLFMITVLLINSIREPITNLTLACENITAGNYGTIIDDNASDEINELVVAFNKMSEQTAFLIKEVYQKEALQSQTELQLLRSQINPHFMYNTLETIRAASILSHNDDITKMVSLFGKILRYSVSNISSVVTVNQAIEYIQDYVSLQQLHYKQDVIVNIAIDPAINNALILKLILQPIVENCFTHSNGSQCRTIIDIIGYEECETIVFRITDNGPGASCNTVSALNNYINGKNEDFHSIGLKNVNRRIKLFYGEEYGLLFESQENIGSTVSITVPFIEENEND